MQDFSPSLTISRLDYGNVLLYNNPQYQRECFDLSLIHFYGTKFLPSISSQAVE